MAYTKTTWVDGVNGNTPINATNLNNIEDGVEANDTNISTMLDDFYFKNGDTYTYNTDIYCSGALSSSKTTIFCTIPLPKRAKNLNATITSATIYVRSSTGNLINGESISNASSITINTSETYLTVQLVYPAFSQQTNNIPLSVAFRNLSLSFSYAS